MEQTRDPQFGLADAIRTMVPRRAPYSGICGETFDHDEQLTFEDAELVQWVCRNCGAEGEYVPDAPRPN